MKNVQNGRHDVIHFEFSKSVKKSHWQISSRSFVESFIKIDLSVWAVEMIHKHAQTDRQTDTHTHRHPRFDHNIFSQNLTEYENMCFQLFLVFGKHVFAFGAYAITCGQPNGHDLLT